MSMKKLGKEGSHERFIFCADSHELEEFKVHCVRLHVTASARLRWLMRADNMEALFPGSASASTKKPLGKKQAVKA